MTPLTPATDLPTRLAEAEQLVRAGQVAQGLQLAQAAWPEAERDAAPALQADCQRIIGMAQQYAGDQREALRAHYRALDLYAAAQRPDGVARVLSIAAVSLANIGDSAQALDMLTRAQSIAKSLEDPGTAFRIQVNMSVVYETLEDHQKAIVATESALAIAESLQDPHMVAHARTNLHGYMVQHAVVLQRSGATADASTLFKAALQGIQDQLPICRSAGLDHMVASHLSAGGAALLALGDLNAARSMLDEALALCAPAGLQGEEARTLITLGQVELAAGRVGAAMDRLRSAHRIAEQLGERDLIAKCQLQLSLTLETQGDFHGALGFFRRYHDTQTAVLRSQATTRTQVLSIQLDNERARLETELLRMKTTELERDKRYLISQTEQLTRHANEDPLTGLGNRRYFEHHLTELRAPDNPSGINSGSIVLAIADIDHFKLVNDRFSHALGDQVLQQVAALFREHCRPQDVIARFGGEEFVVAFIGLAPQQAHGVADRLRQRIERHPWGDTQPGLAVTISVGLAVCSPGEAAEESLARADRALYAAKHAGRNQVSLAGEGEPA